MTAILSKFSTIDRCKCLADTLLIFHSHLWTTWSENAKGYASVCLFLAYTVYSITGACRLTCVTESIYCICGDGTWCQPGCGSRSLWDHPHAANASEFHIVWHMLMRLWWKLQDVVAVNVNAHCCFPATCPQVQKCDLEIGLIVKGKSVSLLSTKYFSFFKIWQICESFTK